MAVNLGGVVFYTDDVSLRIQMLAMIGAAAYLNRAALLALLRAGVGTVSEVGAIGRLVPVALSGNQSRGVTAVMGAILTAVTFGVV